MEKVKRRRVIACCQIEDGGSKISKAKKEVEALLNKLPDDFSLEDIQYHLYVMEKIPRGIERAEK